MLLFQLLEALGGLGLFVFGMKTMADGLQRFASGRFRRLVEKLGGNRLSAALMGGCLSSLLQSSGAASILIIGFVNAGLLSLYQALGMLVGRDLVRHWPSSSLPSKYLFSPCLQFLSELSSDFSANGGDGYFLVKSCWVSACCFSDLKSWKPGLLPLGQAGILPGNPFLSL